MKSLEQLLTTYPFKGPCERCGSIFEGIASGLFQQKICGPCYANDLLERLDALEREEQQKRLERWEKECPRAFRETEPHLLPRPELLTRVMSWKFGHRGMLLHGPTRTGKSRCMHLLLKRECLDGRSFRILDASFVAELNAQYDLGPAAFAKYLKALIETEILLLDDVFKARLTDHAEAALFQIIDGRLKAMRPILITTNDTAETLAARLSPDRRDPLLQRLREACEDVPVV